MLYDLSFQLSFLAVFSILIFLPLHPTFRKSDSLTIKLSKYCLSSLLMTGSVMFGIWPLISNVFSRLSLETFWLNLVMVPLLGVDYPSALSNFLTDQSFLFGNASL